MKSNTKQFVSKQYADSANLDIRIRLHELYSTAAHDWHGWVFEQLAFDEGTDIIEFGCGAGSLWSKNRDKLQPKWRITLTDQSEGMLDKAKRAIGDMPTITFRRMDVQAVEANTASFDIAIANHMLYHVPSIPVALAEIRRIVRPGGVFYAATNGASHMQEIYDLVREFDPTLPFTKPLNAQYFGLENGKTLLGGCFDEVNMVRYPDSLRVTNVNDLAAYMFSIGSGLEDAIKQRGCYEQFIAFLESKRNGQGFISITKDSGIFVCR